MLETISLFEPATLAVFGTLAFLSLLTLSVVAFKALQFVRLGVGRHRDAENILDDWLDGRIDRAVEQAGTRRSVMRRVLQAVFSGLQARPEEQSYAEELARQTALVELSTMSDRMRLLEMVVQAAPMLGLLGTVIGMIDAFTVLSLSEGGVVDPAGLAGGIWVALSTTAAGLGIALVAYFFATWFESRIDRERNAIETLTSVAIHGRIEPGKAGS